MENNIKFIDSVGEFIENEEFVKFNRWFYTQEHKNNISIVASSNRTIWGWLKQYAFETNDIVLEVINIYPSGADKFPKEKFRGVMTVPGKGKNSQAHYQEFDTMDNAMAWIVRKYFNYERGK